MKKSRVKILIILLISVFLLTGCTKQLLDSDIKPVKNPETGQTLTKNILCKPTDKDTIKIYEENKVKIEKLPDCEDFKPTDGKYEGIWTSLFVKPLAFILILLGTHLGNFAVSVIIVSLIIRFIAYPITKKTAMQSEVMKELQPELQKIQKKYKGKEDQESMMKQNQEMMALYKKYNVNPMGGCLFAMIQLPIFVAFFEAIQRTPAIFEDKFLGLQLGTTPSVGISTSTFYAYALLIIIIGFSTFFSMRMSTAGNNQDPTMKMMPTMMTGMIVITGIFMPTGLGIYWVTSNIFTLVQNYLVRRSKGKDGKTRISSKNKRRSSK